MGFLSFYHVIFLSVVYRRVTSIVRRPFACRPWSVVRVCGPSSVVRRHSRVVVRASVVRRHSRASSVVRGPSSFACVVRGPWSVVIRCRPWSVVRRHSRLSSVVCGPSSFVRRPWSVVRRRSRVVRRPFASSFLKKKNCLSTVPFGVVVRVNVGL